MPKVLQKIAFGIGASIHQSQPSRNSRLPKHSLDGYRETLDCSNTRWAAIEKLSIVQTLVGQLSRNSRLFKHSLGSYRETLDCPNTRWAAIEKLSIKQNIFKYNVMTTISILNASARVNEVGGTAENLLKAYHDAPIADDASLHATIALLEEKNAQLITAIEKNKAHSLLESFDQNRDGAFRACYQYLEACTLLPAGEAQVAAERIFAIFEKYGLSMIRMSYIEQTAQMKSIIEELEVAEIKAQVAAIAQLDVMVENLKQTQSDFQQAHSKYTSQLSVSKGEQSASELKPVVMEVINDQLVMYMRAMTKISPNTHEEFARKIAVEINRANQNIKTRGNTKQA
ncbi:MAG: DUF6261 family protein [Bacteroidales bacterium]